MSIQFEQIDAVIQRDGEGEGEAAPRSSGGAPPAPHRPMAEQMEEHHRRHEWMTRRITAD